VKLDLTELLQAIGNEADIEKIEKVSFPEDNLILTKPVKTKLHLINTGTSVLATGELETETELECSRCLKKYNIPLVVKIEDEFASEPPEQTTKNIELKETDFVYPIDPDNTIDLTEVVRQNLLIRLPTKPLCKQDCSGLKN